MNKITIIVDDDEVKQLAERGGTFIFKPEAETAILDLLALRDRIDGYITHVKEIIAQAGEAVSPGFKGVVGERLKASYRVFGEKYTYDKELFEELVAVGILKKSENYKVDSKNVDKYVKKHKQLPNGVHTKERTPVISFTVKKDEEAPTLPHTHVPLDEGSDR